MIKSTRTVLLIIFLFSMLAISMVVKIKAEVVGVSQGNVFEYDMVAHWISPSGDNTPVELLELNQTKSLRVTVAEVSGSVISSQITAYYLNGTEVSSDGSCDIETGECLGLPFIGANLGKNDLVNPSASEPWYINETITRNYKDAPRETNHLKFENSQTIEGIGELNSIYDYYFDKNTGVLVDYTTEVSYSDSTWITQSKLTASNIWSVSDDQIHSNDQATGSTTTLYIAASVTTIVIGVIAVFVVSKRRRGIKSEIEEE